jgi:hypothetical protein
MLPLEHNCSVYTLKLEAICASEILVLIYQAMLCHNTEERSCKKGHISLVKLRSKFTHMRKNARAVIIMLHNENITVLMQIALCN